MGRLRPLADIDRAERLLALDAFDGQDSEVLVVGHISPGALVAHGVKIEDRMVVLAIGGSAAHRVELSLAERAGHGSALIGSAFGSAFSAASISLIMRRFSSADRNPMIPVRRATRFSRVLSRLRVFIGDSSKAVRARSPPRPSCVRADRRRSISLAGSRPSPP